MRESLENALSKISLEDEISREEEVLEAVSRLFSSPRIHPSSRVDVLLGNEGEKSRVVHRLTEYVNEETELSVTKSEVKDALEEFLEISRKSILESDTPVIGGEEELPDLPGWEDA